MRVPSLAVVILLAPAFPVLATLTNSAAAAVPCQRSYESVVNEDIQTGSADTSVALNVPDALVVEDVDVMVDISHPTDADVSVVIHRDEGLWRTLTDGNGGGGDDFDHTIFDDEASTSITAGSAPFAGRYKPMETMDVYDGESAAGNWYLMVKESNLHSGDVFRSWALTLTFETCDLDADGVEDHVDQCVGLAGATASGCPEKERTLSLTYRNASDTFAGRLESTVNGCIADRPVTIWRVREGEDAKVGGTRTRRDGGFALARDRMPGSFYATSPRVVVRNKGECAKSTSPRLRLR